MTPDALTAALKEEAARLGFDLAGATPAVTPPDLDYFRQWLDDGREGRMQWMPDRFDAYRHPSGILDGARSLLMLGINYRSVEPENLVILSAAKNLGDAKGRDEILHCAQNDGCAQNDRFGEKVGRISRFAWGEDYHAVIRGRLRRLVALHRRLVPLARSRGVVDTAPLFEKRFGQLAGLGWIGKNTLLINPRFGSWIFLAALLTTEELVYDEPFHKNLCGDCRACLDACPTGALTAPGCIDARRCISYLTIERRGDRAVSRGQGDSHIFADTKIETVPGDRLYGCDACQEACPWNRQTPVTAEPAFYPRENVQIDEICKERAR